MKGYFLLFTTSSALYAYEVLKDKPNMEVSLVPTPREFSSDCGMAIYIESENIKEAAHTLDKERIEYEYHDVLQ